MVLFCVFRLKRQCYIYYTSILASTYNKMSFNFLGENFLMADRIRSELNLNTYGWVNSRKSSMTDHIIG